MSGIKSEFGVSVADNYWQIVKIVDKPSGMYVIFTIPKVGLHISFHPPNLANPNFHLHVKSAKFGIEEDIDTDFLSDFSSTQWVDEFLQVFRIQPTIDDQRIMVLPPNLFASGSPCFQFGDAKSIINLDNLLNGTFYLTQGRNLPKLQRHLAETNVIDNYDSLVVAGESGRGYLTLDSKHVLEFEANSLLKKFSLGFDAEIFAPLKKTFEMVAKRCPNALQEWVPPNFSDNIQSTLKTTQFKIIDF